jgi:hypothetical protein
MVSDDSPRPTDCIMIDLSAILAQTSSDHACASDGYFSNVLIRPLLMDMWSDSGWFLGGFGVVGHLTSD